MRPVGLDHVAFAVPSVEAMLSWQQRLTGLGVPNSPDEVAIELYAMKPAFAAELGLAGGRGAGRGGPRVRQASPADSAIDSAVSACQLSVAADQASGSPAPYAP